MEWLGNAKLVLPDRVVSGCVLIEDGVIAAVLGRPWPEENAAFTDLHGQYLAPGFVELHSHGAGGADFMDGTPEAFRAAAQTHLRHGVTTLFPTSVAASLDSLTRFLRAFKQVKCSHMPGVHLEGPYLNTEMRGAIDPRYIKNPDPAEYDALLDFAGGDIKRWTIAPELPGALAFGDLLAGQGILPSIGHTCANYAQLKEAAQHGFNHFTHLYSAMSTITRVGGFRVTGAIESAYILEDATVEVIADGCHLPLELLNYVWRAKGADRVCLTGDSMRCAGTAAAVSVIGSLEDGLPVVVEDGVAKLPDRSAFAGSVAMADRLLRTALGAGILLHEAVRMMTRTPARVMGLEGGIGAIEIGKQADLVVFDSKIQIKSVMKGGTWV
ncbi:MAG: N-acetylglucosamine-6-phosphate deacetylase [Clostridia bacterium]|nr:N-acetylglucosamine-6-phosphate deacetylase [Clostridia bacterium]